MQERLLELKELSLTFQNKVSEPLLQDLSLTLSAGELVAVIGASGSGKSLLAHAIMGILPETVTIKGEMFFAGKRLDDALKSKVRGKEICLIPQNVSYLDPTMTIGRQITNGYPKREAKLKALLNRYGLPEDVSQLYPHALSGGMARRILIATAVIEEPKLIIADEPTVGLDRITAQRVLAHLREIADQKAAVLLITHDLLLALTVADRVVVLYAGVALEEALAADFKQEDTLRHPYTKALWRAMPQNGFQFLPGAQPMRSEPLKGCVFAPRCPKVSECCKAKIPWEASRGGFVRCVKAAGEVTF